MSELAEIIDRKFFLNYSNEKLFSVNARLIKLETKEGLSHCQSFILDFESPDVVDLDDLLGEQIAIYVGYSDGQPAFFNALADDMDNNLPCFNTRLYSAWVTAGYDLKPNGNKYVYQLEMSSWLWFLSQNRNCRIFQDKNVIEIVEEVFSHYSGIAEFSVELDDSYARREYCAQFEESDLNFINRLLEEEGIWYYFRYEYSQDEGKDKDVMVITDRQQFEKMPDGYDRIPFLENTTDGLQEGIQAIHRSRKVRPNEVVLRDYDYLHPGNNLQVDQEAPESGLPRVRLEWYDYATGYSDTSQGEKLARLRLQMMQSERQLLQGESNVLGLRPGYAFTLTRHPDVTRNRGFKLIEAHYTYDQGGDDSASGLAARSEVSCKIIALNDDVPNRPRMLTPRPAVSGLQSATVVGPPGSEVYTDNHARIRVHFHWDRYKTTEEDSSCWVRVAQAWAGKGWGMIAMPRVGQEVLITYVDGDLSRPLVTGIVYNGENPPPYDLPKQIGHTGIKSRSLQHGLPQNQNEITLVDDRGEEKVIIHAERDMRNTVENNLDIWVDNNRFDRVTNDYYCLFNNHYYYTNLRFKVTGLGVHLTNIQKDITGIHSSIKMVDAEFIAMKTSVLGMDTTFTAVGTHVNGMKTNFNVIDTTFSGMDNNITGLKIDLTVTENSLTGFKSGFTGVNNDFIGMDNSAILNKNSMVGVKNSIVGINTELYGINTVRMGNFLNINAAEVSIVGVRNENYGMYVGNMLTKIVNNGSVINNTDYESRNVGILLIN